MCGNLRSSLRSSAGARPPLAGGRIDSHTRSAARKQASRIFRSRDFRPFPPPWPLPVFRRGHKSVDVVGLAGKGDDADLVTARFADGELRLSVKRRATGPRPARRRRMPSEESGRTRAP